MGWITLIRRARWQPVDSLAARPSRTVPRLGGGLIRCREEDVEAASCMRELDGPNMSAGKLSYYRTHKTGTSAHLTHGAASAAMPCRASWESFGRWALAGRVWGTFSYVMNRRTYARLSELGTGLRRGRAVNRALIWLIRANPTQISHTTRTSTARRAADRLSEPAVRPLALNSN